MDDDHTPATPGPPVSESLRDRILNTDDSASEIVEIPQWNANVEVRSMSGRERASILSKMRDRKGNMKVETLYPEIIVAGAYDPDTGEKLFGREDIDRLNNKLAGPLENLAQAVLRVSGLDDDAETAAEGN